MSVITEELVTTYTIQYSIMRNIPTIIMATLAVAGAGRIGKVVWGLSGWTVYTTTASLLHAMSRIDSRNC